MSHTQTILTLLGVEPGLTDRQISEHTGITPVQQVNSICRRLAATGEIRRTKGPNGAVINMPAGAHPPTVTTSQTRMQPHRKSKEPTGDSTPWEQLRGLNPARTLIVLPCSAGKRLGGVARSGPPITDALPDTLAAELTAARARVAPRAHLDTSELRPAWLRYSGTFYTAAHEALLAATQGGAHIVILSGGYGLVEATEPIGDYEAPMKMSWWPSSLLGRCLVAYARHHGLIAMAAFLAYHTDYGKVVRSTPWDANGLCQAFLVSPDLAGRGGGMVLVPRAAGEAFSAFWRGDLTHDWSSTDGLTLRVESLP